MKQKQLIILLISLAGVLGKSAAQQRPYYTQYILNTYIINPAVAGIENYWDIKASHRMQWVGLQDAPVTTYFTIQGPLKKSAYDRETATSFHARGENPRGQAYWQDYTSAEPHAGVGLTILNDQTGPLNRFAAYGTYAYHLGLSPRTSLSLGVSAGITQLSLNADKLNFATPVDPAVAQSGIINTIKPDISAGVWLYSRDYFVGLSVQQIIPQQVAFSNNTVQLQNGKLLPHTFLTAGYRMFISEDVSFLPSVMLRYINPLPIGVDLNMKFQYQDLVWAGASFRYKDGFAAMFGVNLSNQWNIGYSYDVSTSQLNTVSKGTHEILVGFLLGNKYGDWCPRNLW
ncbi:MAG: type IX secretion system membrane protein PorP/SprF [Bacteroidota bacterium]|nr:type IX secretion system membrane protein PorP/SprF [Bacteroidota bacterium]